LLDKVDGSQWVALLVVRTCPCGATADWLAIEEENVVSCRCQEHSSSQSGRPSTDDRYVCCMGNGILPINSLALMLANEAVRIFVLLACYFWPDVSGAFNGGTAAVATTKWRG
jgi:hypothetical protein